MGRHYTGQPGSRRHYYRRPEWVCLACGEPWPCEIRRADFLDKFQSEGMRLRGIMGALALDASKDLRLTTDEAHARFAGWTLGLTDEPERTGRSTASRR